MSKYNNNKNKKFRMINKIKYNKKEYYKYN